MKFLSLEEEVWWIFRKQYVRKTICTETICTETDSVGAGRFAYRTQSTLVQTDPSVQWASSTMSAGALSQGFKWPWSRVDHPPPLVLRLRIGRGMSVFLTVSSWHVTSIIFL
jgi:hypothetical protein